MSDDDIVFEYMKKKHDWTREQRDKHPGLYNQMKAFARYDPDCPDDVREALAVKYTVTHAVIDHLNKLERDADAYDQRTN